jgi:hypothetical protein
VLVLGELYQQTARTAGAEVIVTRELLEEIALGTALSLMVYNCGWALRHMPRPIRKRAALFAGIFSTFPVLGSLDISPLAPWDIFIDAHASGNPHPMNTVYFVVRLIAFVIGFSFYEAGLLGVLRRAMTQHQLHR